MTRSHSHNSRRTGRVTRCAIVIPSRSTATSTANYFYYLVSPALVLRRASPPLFELKEVSSAWINSTEAGPPSEE